MNTGAPPKRPLLDADRPSGRCGPCVSRRTALGALAAGAAALVAPGRWGLRAAPVRSYELVAEPARRSLLGARPQWWLYNRSLPGPVIEAREGEVVRIAFTNRLPEPTNLHFHGLHIPPQGRADNIYLDIPPGGRFLYEFQLPPGSAGLYWYHPHRHRLVARQMWRGLAGALVVRGPDDAFPALAAFEERIVLLRDVALPEGELSPHGVRDWHKGKEGDWVVANGGIEPVFPVARGGVRLRLINASNARPLHLARGDGRPLAVAAVDGRLLPRPRMVASYLLPPAGRVDLLVPLGREEEVPLVALRYNRGVPSPRLRNRFLLALRGAGSGPPLPLPDRLPAPPPPPAPERAPERLALSMFFINGRSYRRERVDVRRRLGEVQLWRVENVGSMDHPFHLHTWPFYVLGSNRWPAPVAGWADTVNLRPGEVLELLVPFVGYTGRTVFHCHVVEHADRGMMGTVEVVEG